MKKILAIEDDPKAAQLLKLRLEAAGYGCDTEARGDTGLNALLSKAYTAAIVDLGLPAISGGELIQRARDAGVDIPIIILTANTEEVALLDNLGRRANDFIRKPYRISELLCRLATRISDKQESNTTIVHGNLLFDTLSKTVTKGPVRFSLPNYEARSLELLLRNKGRFLPKETIMHKAWGYDHQIDVRTVTRTVSRLNSILEAYGIVGIIENRRDIGYVISQASS